MNRSFRQLLIRTIAAAVVGVVLDEAKRAFERYFEQHSRHSKTSPRVEVLREQVSEPVDHAEAVAKKIIEWAQQSDASESLRRLVRRANESENNRDVASAASRIAGSALDSAKQAWLRRA